MSLFQKSEGLNNPIYIVGALIFGLLVLFISIARASLQITAEDYKENKLRIVPIPIEISINSDPSAKFEYKFPDVSTLPGSWLYGLKDTRDFLWINFSRDLINKSEIALFIADKKMLEVSRLIEMKKNKLALESSVGAFEKLKYADKILSENNLKTIKANELRRQIFLAGFAYKKILEPIKEDPDLKNEYEAIVNNLDKWNEEKQKSYKEI